MVLEIVLPVALILFGLTKATEDVLAVRQRQRDEGEENNLFL
jgi:hypothetical protein